MQGNIHFEPRGKIVSQGHCRIIESIRKDSRKSNFDCVKKTA